MSEIKIIYDGAHPNLCSGKLIAVVDGVKWVFPDYCLSPGGSIGFDDDWNEHVEQGPWTITEWPGLLPENLKEPIEDAVNEQVEWGNCGGCI